MARSHTFSDHGFARPKQGRGRKPAPGATLAAGALLAVALNAVGAQDGQSAQTTELATTQSGARLVAYTGRAVELDQAIMGFR